MSNINNFTESDSNTQTWYNRLPDAPHILAHAESIGTRIQLPKNHVLINAGEIPTCCYITISGIVTGFEYTSTAEERTYNFDHFNNQNIILLDAHVLTDYPVPVTIRTQTPAELIRITKEQLLDAIRSNPDFSLEIIRSTSYKFFSAVNQLREARCNKTSVITGNLFLGLAHRYGVPYKDKIVISEPFTQQELANLLGVNRITLVRTLKELRELGLIGNVDRMYCIPSIEKLRAFVLKDEPYY